MLKKNFEPLSKASVKLTTFKTIFLMSICTSEDAMIRGSLCLGEEDVCVQKKDGTFVRQEKTVKVKSSLS